MHAMAALFENGLDFNNWMAYNRSWEYFFSPNLHFCRITECIDRNSQLFFRRFVMLKRIISLALVCAMILCFLPASVSASGAEEEKSFTDVPADAWYADPVNWAVENGITTGTTDTTFNPSGICQRATVVTFLWRAAGSPEPASSYNPFRDVAADAFYYKPVLWAVEQGITNGLSTNAFGPYEQCNRAQVVTFLYRAEGSPSVASTGTPFSDVKATDWYGPAVLWAVKNGITNGLTATEFGVNSTCNRAQVVTFLYRTYNK